MMRKGQGAMEYLMTYGWALLVIVIVGAALFALGVLNPATYQQKRCTGFQYFTWSDHQLTASGLVIALRNSNQKITLNNITVDGTVGTGTTPASTVTINEAGNITITTTVATGRTSGSSYSDLAVIINYTAVDGIPGLIDTATCIGTVA